jgi:hypothetical protein
MCADDGKIVPMYERVIHVAFGCGCTHTFHVKRQDIFQKCPDHGDWMIDSIEGLREKVNEARCG